VSKASIHQLSQDIARALNGTHEDILRLIDGGHLRIEVEKQPAFLPIFQTNDGQVIVADSQVRYRYLEWADHLALVREERKKGAGFFQIIRKIRAMETEIALGAKKVALMGPETIHGHDTVLQYFMGTPIRMRRDMCIPFHHFVLQHIFAQHVHAGLDVVFDIGSGIGDSVSELAARNPFSNIDFIGGEIALNGQKCIAEFAGLLGLPNLRGVEFDMTRPNFDFLKGKKNALVYSQFAMVCLNPFQEQFFEKLLDSVENVTALFFEPFSFALADEMNFKPGFTRNQAKNYGIADNFWACIKNLEQAGRIVIEDVVPDIVGKTLLSTISLVRFHKKAGTPK